MRRVHHASAANVNADVSEPGKEEQVAGPHSGSCHAPSLVVERVRAVRQPNAQPPVRPVDKPGAVEPGWGGPSPSIRHANLFDGDSRRALADGRHRNRRERIVPIRRLPGNRCRCTLRRAYTDTAEGDRGKRVRQQGAAERGRHREEGTTGPQTLGRAARGLFLTASDRSQKTGAVYPLALVASATGTSDEP